MNNRKNLTWLVLAGVILTVIILAVLTWFNLSYTRQNPGGNDFLVHWVGTRSYVLEGISPYSDEAARRIQTMAYGRPAQAGEHELRVAYPLYSIVLFLPFALIPDFDLARALWMTLLEVGLIALSFVCLRLTHWKPWLAVLAFFFLFSILWYHGLRPLINGNAVILIALMFAGALLAIREGADELAGVLLGFSTIKPQLAILLLLFILIWGISTKRWRLIVWMVGTVVLLSASAALLMPDWILQNVREVLRYPGYNPPGTLTSALTALFPGIGRRVGRGISILLAILLLTEWWLARKSSFRGFIWAACLTLVISQWIGIQTDPGNFIILFPALVLVFAMWEERWRKGGIWLSVISMLILFFGLWALFLTTVQQGNQPQQSPIMFLPLPAFLLITLYWIRWWAVRPASTWYDFIYSQENPKL